MDQGQALLGRGRGRPRRRARWPRPRPACAEAIRARRGSRPALEAAPTSLGVWSMDAPWRLPGLCPALPPQPSRALPGALAIRQDGRPFDRGADRARRPGALGRALVAFPAGFADRLPRRGSQERAAKHLWGLLAPVERGSRWQVTEAVGEGGREAMHLACGRRWSATAAGTPWRPRRPRRSGPSARDGADPGPRRGWPAEPWQRPSIPERPGRGGGLDPELPLAGLVHDHGARCSAAFGCGSEGGERWGPIVGEVAPHDRTGRGAPRGESPAGMCSPSASAESSGTPALQPAVGLQWVLRAQTSPP